MSVALTLSRQASEAPKPELRLWKVVRGILFYYPGSRNGKPGHAIPPQAEDPLLMGDRGKEHPMTTRRGFLTTAGAVAAHEHAHAQDQDHDHEHQAAPSD